MPVQIIVGAQWGDEGKGKIVDLLSEKVDIVARYQGGANAGHTVVIGDKQSVLHLIPSGIFHPHTVCVIGNGVVVDPSALLSEIEQLHSAGIATTGRLLISANAHVIMPYHKLLDSLREKSGQAIGTTGRGIGPCYIDKAMRIGIRIGDLLDTELLSKKIATALEEKNSLLASHFDNSPLSASEITAQYAVYADKLREYITDTSTYLNHAIQAGKYILAEGAQGALLDVDHGTYPYVTSSNPTSGGACTGLGIPPTSITNVLGIVKAYSTRVGNGPFPTEQNNEIGNTLRIIGGEFGATTGRPRRCGWFDAFSLRYSAMINGITDIAITKLDVLDTFDEIKICTGYEWKGKELKTFPADIGMLESVTPKYVTLKGWQTPTTAATRFEELPERAQTYLRALAETTGAKISMVSVGARRDRTIMVS